MSAEKLTKKEAERKAKIAERKAKKEAVDLARLKIINKDLLERYPFLLPRDMTDSVPEDYDYSYTVLDMMPEGWKNAFGTQLCEDIKNVLLKADYLDDYRIAEIKEKYGQLRWYDYGVPEEISDELQDVIDYYTELSEETCVLCGKRATHYTKGWIMPVCVNCGKKLGVSVDQLSNIMEDDEDVW